MNNMKPDYNKAIKSAHKILKEHGLITPPINPIELARSMGVSVHFVTFKDPEIRAKVSGFYDASEDAIYVNEEEYPLRQTFTIAHELGHRILHKQWAMSNEYEMLLRQEASNNQFKDAREKEADVFAANLLVPRFMLDEYSDIATEATLSRLFAVSKPVIKNRLNWEYGT